MTAKEIAQKALSDLQTFNMAPYMPALRAANDGAIDDVLNTNGNAYYQWGMCLVKNEKPKQIVELGGAL
jgi:hypothetical protein